MNPERGNVLESLLKEAIRLGAGSIQVEYKDQREEVFAMNGGVGVGIATFRASSPEAAALREALYDLSEHEDSVWVGDVQYKLRCRVFEAFGEDSFDVTWETA
jgi:hypothetical protein